MARPGRALRSPEIIDWESLFRHFLRQSSIYAENAANRVLGINRLHLYRNFLLAFRQFERNRMTHVVVLAGHEEIEFIVGELCSVAIDVVSAIAAITTPLLRDEIHRTPRIDLQVVTDPAPISISPP